jgi:hypothetical protein
MIVPRDAGPDVLTCSEAWAECLRERGLEVSTIDVSATSDSATTVIVAPHAALRPLADDALRIAGALQRAVCLSTSRLGSGALGADRPFHKAAAASVALSRDAARYLSAHGVATAHLKPGAHDGLRSGAAGSRSIGVGLHARYSGYREDLLARSRDVLDPHSCDLRISRSPEASPPEHLEPARWRDWLANVDVLVSLPQEPGPGTDWCELAPAVMNGAVVLTTAESDFGPLEPGDDVAVATSGAFADSLRRLLADPDRRERMRATALERLSASPLDVTPLVDAIRAVEVTGRRVRPLRAAESAASVTAVVPAAEAQPAEAVDAAEAARARRQQARTGAADRITTTTGWDTAPEAAVSVVIPSYDQEAFVGEAVASALAAVGVAI